MKRVMYLTRVRTKLGNNASVLNARLRSVSRSKRATYTVATATAFIIAPVAALTLNAKANSSVNLETAPSTTADSSATTDAILNEAIEATATDGQASAGNSQSSSVETSLNVNGEDFDVPKNGNVNEVITNEDGSTTHVVVNSSSSSSSANDDQDTRSKVRINSSTTVRTYTRTSQ